MSSTNKTANYQLSQFISTDKPTWLVDYNTDMYNIDSAIKDVSDVADANTGNITLLTGRMTSAEGNIVNLQASSSQHGTDITDLKAKDIVIENNITSLSTDVSGLKNKSILSKSVAGRSLSDITLLDTLSVEEDGIYLVMSYCPCPP